MEVTIRTEDLINYSDAAKTLGVSRVTLYAIIKRGKLHPVAVGRNRFLQKQEVEKLKAERNGQH